MPSPEDSDYISLLVSVGNPYSGIRRYALGMPFSDLYRRGIDPDDLNSPEMRDKLTSALYEDWIRDEDCIVCCERIAGTVQWMAPER